MLRTLMSRTSYWQRRLSRHFFLLLLAGAFTWIAYALTPPPDFRHRFSMATAYSGLVFLAFTLGLAPWNVLRRRANPVSFDLRRDVGIWAGLLAIIHTVVGLNVHLRGRMWMYFFKRLHPVRLQDTQFGFANYAGLVAALLFIMLLLISNDVSLRQFGTHRWKSLQRWTYVAAALTIAHGVAYQLIEKRQLPWVVIFAVITVVLVILQLLGVLRKKHPRSAYVRD